MVKWEVTEIKTAEVGPTKTLVRIRYTKLLSGLESWCIYFCPMNMCPDKLNKLTKILGEVTYNDSYWVGGDYTNEKTADAVLTSLIEVLDK